MGKSCIKYGLVTILVFLVVFFNASAQTASNTGPYCAGSTLQLMGGNPSGFVGYSWTGPNGYAVSGAATPNDGINENFDGTVTGWSFSGVSIGTVVRCSGNSLLFTGKTQVAITPPITNPWLLNCNIRRGGDASSWSLDVQISSASPASQTSGPWTTVASIGSTVSMSCSSVPTIDLSPYTGLRYVRFVDTRASGANNRSLDNVIISALATEQNQSIANATTAMSGVYTFSTIDPFGQTSTATTTVQVGASVPGTITPVAQTICKGTVPASLSLSGTVGTILKWQSSPNATFATSVTDISNTTTTLTLGALTSTTYYRAVVQQNLCTIAYSIPVGIAITTSIWTGTWDITPTGNTSLVFNGDYISSGDLSGCSCLVKSGNTVVFGDSNLETLDKLVIADELTVEAGASLVFNNNSSLIQSNNVVSNTNSGNITYKRTNTTSNKLDYTYWSSPVKGQTLYNMSPNTSSSMFYSFDSSKGTDGDWLKESGATVMSTGKGYIAGGAVPIAPNPPAVWTASFIGVPNNGSYSITGVIADKSYLIGNPYPSALDADTFSYVNAGVLDGTLYFWTHNTAIDTNGQYTSDDYASYNLTGGVGTSALSGGNTPTGKIAAGQGFFASSNATITGANEILFDNDMRAGVGGITGNNNQFFKGINKIKSKTFVIEKDRIWLDLKNSQGAFKQTLIGYITGATNGYDAMFDGESFDGNDFIDFYSINLGVNLAIQGRALPFDENDVVPLGYRTVIAGDFTISIDQVDGLFLNADQNIYLEDKLLNTIHDLKQSPYDFTTLVGVFNDRFVLRYTNSALFTDVFAGEGNKVIAITHNSIITLKSEVEKMTSVVIYDVLGREIESKKKINDNEVVFDKITPSNQVLLVKITLENGQKVTEKVVL